MLSQETAGPYVHICSHITFQTYSCSSYYSCKLKCRWNYFLQETNNSIRRPGIVWSVKRLAMGWKARGSNPAAGEIFYVCPVSGKMEKVPRSRWQSCQGVRTTHPIWNRDQRRIEISFHSTPPHAFMEYYRVKFNNSILMICVGVTEVLHERFRKLAKSYYRLRHVCLFVGLSFRKVHLWSHWRDFHEIWYVRIFRKSVEKIQIPLKSDKNSRYFTYLAKFFLEWEMFQKISKHIFCTQ